MDEPNTDVIQGTLDMLILRTLSLRPMHAFGCRELDIVLQLVRELAIRRRSVREDAESARELAPE